MGTTGCALDPERSNFTGLGFGACEGEVRYLRKTVQVEGFDPLEVRVWECERHAAQDEN